MNVKKRVVEMITKKSLNWLNDRAHNGVLTRVKARGHISDGDFRPKKQQSDC